MGKQYELFTDGASRGNPGPSSYGFVIFEEGNLIAQAGKKIGLATNNIAEYKGIIFGLKECLKLGGSQVILKSDSQLLIRQLEGRYKVKAPLLKPLFAEASALLTQFEKTILQHVPREENKLADELANMALDGEI